MRKIDITPYDATIIENGVSSIKPYEITLALINLMFSPELGLSARGFVEQDGIASKIERSGPELILEDREYKRLYKAVESFRGYNRNDVELIRRVMNAEKI